MEKKNINESTRGIIEILNEFKKKHLKNNVNEVINFKDIEDFVLQKKEIQEEVKTKEKKIDFFDSDLNDFILDLYEKSTLEGLVIPPKIKNKEKEMEKLISEKYSEDVELYNIFEKMKFLYYKKGIFSLLSIYDF